MRTARGWGRDAAVRMRGKNGGATRDVYTGGVREAAPPDPADCACGFQPHTPRAGAGKRSAGEPAISNRRRALSSIKVIIERMKVGRMKNRNPSDTGGQAKGQLDLVYMPEHGGPPLMNGHRRETFQLFRSAGCTGNGHLAMTPRQTKVQRTHVDSFRSTLDDDHAWR